MRTGQGRRARKRRQSTVEPVLGTLVNFTGMSQVNTKGIRLANKCMIIAATAYNLKKLVNGIPTKIRKRIRKFSGNGSDRLTDTLWDGILNIQNLINVFKISYKSKWLNNHLLCKLNYSAI